MLKDGIQEIKRKRVEWVDPGTYKEPFLNLQIGDVDVIKKIIEAVRTVSPAFADDIRCEYNELDTLRGLKRKEFGDLPVPSNVTRNLTDKLIERFFDSEREITILDVEDEWDDIQEQDMDLPKFLPDEMIEEIIRNVEESIEEQKDMADNDKWMREASYRW